ncbi:MAG: hypothetical protein H6607_12720 [Flavobacteriales bacterium]|nr:hypothetical protein [Flavobacteriales bacterium]
MKTVKLLFLKNLILGFALIMTMPALAQEYNIENVGRVGIRNSGTIMDGNIIKGYYFFYFSEKISKKENAYEIVVLDENLVEKSSSKMTDSKSAFLLEASYNGKNILFKFYDSKSKTVSYRTIDEAGKVSSKETREPDKTEQMTYLTAVTNELENTNLQAINDKLFVDIYNVKTKKYTFSVQGLNNSGKIVWTYDHVPTSKVETGSFLGSSKDQIWIAVAKAKNITTKNYSFDLMGLNTEGEKDFDIPLVNKKYNMLAINAVYNQKKDEIIVLGEYFDIEDKAMKSDSKGVFIKVISPTGEEISENFISWSRDVADLVSSEQKKELSKYYVFFHNVVQTADGRIYAIGEQYRKQVSAAGVAMNVLAASSSNVSTNASTMEIKFGNMVVLEISPDYELSKVHIHDKKARTDVLPQGYGTVSQHLLARLLKSVGMFDYCFTQNNEDASLVSFAYTDIEKVKGKLKKQAVVHFVHYVQGQEEYSEDKIELSTEASSIAFMAAKPGYVLISEYYKKEKKASFRLEPLNY